MSNVILTPERPQYPGGHWHTDGMDNEQIVAIGLFYYSCENISDSSLSLGDSKLRAGPGRVVDRIKLGSIESREGRVFVFPNTLEHQVAPFQVQKKQSVYSVLRLQISKFLILFLLQHTTQQIRTMNV